MDRDKAVRKTVGTREWGESANICGVSERVPLLKVQPHQDSSQLRKILDPVRGFRDQLQRYQSISTVQSSRRLPLRKGNLSFAVHVIQLPYMTLQQQNETQVAWVHIQHHSFC